MSRSYKYAVLSWPGINKLPDFPDFSLTCSCAGIPVSFASQYRTPFIEPSEKDIRDALKNARMQSDSTISKVAPYLQDILVKVKYVPIDAAASFVESLYNTAYEIDSYGVMPEEGEVLDDSYMVFQVRGDSMEPTIPDGAKILARKIEEGLWESASGVVSIVYGKTLSVKRILKNSLFLDNVLTLKADNPKHGQLDVERREIRGMWQALRIISQKII